MGLLLRQREAEFLGFVEILLRFGLLALLLVGFASTLVCIGVLRVQTDTFAEVGYRLDVVALGQVGTPPVVIRNGILRV